MPAAVHDNGIWKEPNVISVKDGLLWKEVAASDLRLIGAQNAGSSLALSPWEPLKEGDLVVLFAVRTSAGAIDPPTGFTLILSSVHPDTGDRNSAFYAFAGPGGAIPAITAAGANRTAVLVYRGASGIGESAVSVGDAQVLHTVDIAGLSVGSLVAAGVILTTPELAGGGSLNEFGLAIPGGVSGSRFAASTLGSITSPPPASASVFFSTPSASRRNTIAVEILAK